VGKSVGVGVGSSVGSRVGLADGTGVGLAVGFEVGAGVGLLKQTVHNTHRSSKRNVVIPNVSASPTENRKTHP